MIFDLERYNITCPLMVSCYAVLGLQLDASIAEIRAAYKRRALEVHPDKGGSSAEFQLVLAAFEQFRGQKITNEGLEPGNFSLEEFVCGTTKGENELNFWTCNI